LDPTIQKRKTHVYGPTSQRRSKSSDIRELIVFPKTTNHHDSCNDNNPKERNNDGEVKERWRPPEEKGLTTTPWRGRVVHEGG